MVAPRNLTLEFMTLPGPNAAPAVVVAPAAAVVAPVAAVVAPVAAVVAPATPPRGIPPHNCRAPVRHR